MFAEELAKIRESELRAEELRQQAKTEARQALADARAEADRVVSEAGVLAGEIHSTLLNEGQKEAEKQYAAFLEQKRAECAAMIEKARSSEAETVGWIMERIVKRNGDS